MKLYYTPLSHFARKVRIVLAGLGLDAELVDSGSTAGADPGAFGGNPLMAVPTLHDDGQVIFDSDAIAEHLVRRHDPADRYRVLDHGGDRLNFRSVMNGIMAAEVELILATRTGMDTGAWARFDKKRAVIASGLGWLEENASRLPVQPDYLAFHFACMWEHLVVLRNMPATPLPRLEERASVISSLPMVAATRFTRPVQSTPSTAT